MSETTDEKKGHRGLPQPPLPVEHGSKDCWASPVFRALLERPGPLPEQDAFEAVLAEAIPMMRGRALARIVWMILWFPGIRLVPAWFLTAIRHAGYRPRDLESLEAVVAWGQLLAYGVLLGWIAAKLTATLRMLVAPAEELSLLKPRVLQDLLASPPRRQTS